MIGVLPVTVEPFQFSPAEPVAYELSKQNFSWIKCTIRATASYYNLYSNLLFFIYIQQDTSVLAHTQIIENVSNNLQKGH